ncbi:MAG: hypothetical protein M3N43_08380 [Actinomycetota bacterium]|nr:hypothetical protein [Actinomycetota bacterium]
MTTDERVAQLLAAAPSLTREQIEQSARIIAAAMPIAAPAPKPASLRSRVHRAARQAA